MFFETSYFKIYYEKYGTNNKSIIILPGWGNTRSTFYKLIQSLKEDYSVYILDYPGFGESPLLNTTLSMDEYALGIREWIEKIGIHNPHIIAHSFGGRITSLLVGKFNIKVDKILLLDVAGIKRRKKLKDYLKEKKYKLLKKLTYILPKKKQEEVRQKLLIKYSSTDYQSIPNSMKKTFQNIIKINLKKYYKKIQNETLIIWGEKDTDTPIKDAHDLKKIIKNSELIVYQNASHYSYLIYPILTMEICKIFFRSLPLQNAHEYDNSLDSVYRPQAKLK